MYIVSKYVTLYYTIILYILIRWKYNPNQRYYYNDNHHVEDFIRELKNLQIYNIEQLLYYVVNCKNKNLLRLMLNLNLSALDTIKLTNIDYKNMKVLFSLVSLPYHHSSAKCKSLIIYLYVCKLVLIK